MQHAPSFSTKSTMISSLSRQLLPRTATAVASQCSRPAVVVASRPFFSSAPAEPEPTIADETSRTFATKKKGPGLKRDAIVDILANEYGLKKAESTRILNTVFDTIVEVRFWYLTAVRGSLVSCVSSYDERVLLRAVKAYVAVKRYQFGRKRYSFVIARDGAYDLQQQWYGVWRVLLESFWCCINNSSTNNFVSIIQNYLMNKYLHSSQSVTKKETVTIPGFGKFEAVESPPRTYNSPLTGNIPLSKPATTRVKFRPFTHFKECVAEGKVTKK